MSTEIAKKLPVAKYEFVVEATGSSEGLRQAVQMTQPRGTVVMKSTVHGLVSIDTAPVIVNEITLVGSRCGRFEPALKLLEERQGTGGYDDIGSAAIEEMRRGLFERPQNRES